MTDQPQVATAAEERRSRRERRKRRNKTGFWANPALGRRVAMGMAALALVTGGYAAFKMRQASLLFGPLQVGVNEQEVAYLLGQPAQKSPDNAQWTYAAGADTAMTLHFAPDRVVESIDCSAHSDVAFGCPDAMGVGLGTSEDHLLNRLGPPSSYRFIPNGKVITFDDLGLIYTLHQFRVTGYTKVKRSSKIAFLTRLAWNLLP